MMCLINFSLKKGIWTSQRLYGRCGPHCPDLRKVRFFKTCTGSFIFNSFSFSMLSLPKSSQNHLKIAVKVSVIHLNKKTHKINPFKNSNFHNFNFKLPKFVSQFSFQSSLSNFHRRSRPPSFYREMDLEPEVSTNPLRHHPY